jgi:Bifunctional DNA primase/polymerase, N-terminal
MNDASKSSAEGNQSNPFIEPFGKVIDLHPLYAAIKRARELCEANDEPEAFWDPLWPELVVDDGRWDDLLRANWDILGRWYAMCVLASRDGKRLNFEVVDGVETCIVIDLVQPYPASRMMPAIELLVDDTASTVGMLAPSPIATPQELTELRLKLHGNGYHPVPVVGAHVDTNSAGERPTMTAWQTKCRTADPDEISGWSRSQRNNTNTGILCGDVVGVDIDVLNEELSAKLVARAQELFGPTPLRRIGRAPKILLLYRVEIPHDKLSTPDLLFGDGVKAKVEILAEGQQFVAFGIHPDTRAPYHWPDKSPCDIPASDVPVVTLELLQQFVANSEQILRAEGGSNRRRNQRQRGQGKE